MKPILIRHRINQSSTLSTVLPDHGVEIDLRSRVGVPGLIHLCHDAGQIGESFESWLEVFVKMKIKGPIILNTKEDLLEDAAITLLKQFQIENYFFLDTTLPTLVRRCLKSHERTYAVRFSKYEGMQTVEPFKNKADWVWVDCFDREPVALESVVELKKYFKVCLVSPELQGGNAKEFTNFKHLLPAVDAICTKTPEEWSQ